MKIKFKLIIVILCLLFNACANRDLKEEATVYSKAEFEEFKTWRWHVQDQDDSVNEIIHDQVKTKIAAELEQKGLTYKPVGDVDFLVNYIVNVRNDLKVEELNTYEGYSERYLGVDPYGRYINVNEFQMKKSLEESRTVQQIVKGTLIIDILDPLDTKLLMRMIAEKPLPEHKVDPETRQRRINTVIEDLLKKFPPKDET